MAMADGTAGTGAGAGRQAQLAAAKTKVPLAALLQQGAGGASGQEPVESIEPNSDEHFIPVTRSALVDRLTRPQSWPPGIAIEAARFFRYLDAWRQQRHASRLATLVEAYEPFSPDSDLYVTRNFTPLERNVLQRTVVDGVADLLAQANYTEVPRDEIAAKFLTKDSHYGLDLKVDFEVFEELLVFFRGQSKKKAQRRKLKRFFRKEEFNVEIYRRVVVLFKIKSLERHIADVRASMKVSHEEAEKYVQKARAHIPDALRPELADTQDKSGNIFIKIFKNMPLSDLEMLFPNTQVKFRMSDKLWLGVTGGGALGAGVFGAAGKLALAFSNPITAAGAVGGIGMVMFRQIMNVMNQKQRYMSVLAQNLYFHAMADNRGAMSKLADRAAEEDVKEEILLYSILAKETVNRGELHSVDEAIERYIDATFGLHIDFDVGDALRRLIADGIVTELPDGTLQTLSPTQAAARVDKLWDTVLDDLPELIAAHGAEIERPPNAHTSGAGR